MERDKLKVYRFISKVYGETGAQQECIIAALSKKKAFAICLEQTRLGHMTFSWFKGWANETGNDVQRGVALNQPGIVFYKDMHDYNASYVPLTGKKNGRT